MKTLQSDRRDIREEEARMRPRTSRLAAVRNVGSLPVLQMTKTSRIIQSKSDSPLVFVSELPQQMCLEFASVPMITATFHRLASARVALGNNGRGTTPSSCAMYADISQSSPAPPLGKINSFSSFLIRNKFTYQIPEIPLLLSLLRLLDQDYIGSTMFKVDKKICFAALECLRLICRILIF